MLRRRLGVCDAIPQRERQADASTESAIAARISIYWLCVQSVVRRLLRCRFFRYEGTQILRWGPGHQLLRVSVSLRPTVRSRCVHCVHLVRFASPHRVAPLPVRSAARQDVRQLSSRASLQAPAVVQRNLGGMENALFRVDQLRTVEEMDGKQASPCAASLVSAMPVHAAMSRVCLQMVPWRVCAWSNASNWRAYHWPMPTLCVQ